MAKGDAHPRREVVAISVVRDKRVGVRRYAVDGLIDQHDDAELANLQVIGSPSLTLLTAVLAIPPLLAFSPYLFTRLCASNTMTPPGLSRRTYPCSLGRPAREVWDEIWEIIGPQIEQVMTGGAATWHENQLIPITRNGKSWPRINLAISLSPDRKSTEPAAWFFSEAVAVCRKVN
jgi:hypothetical protein